MKKSLISFILFLLLITNMSPVNADGLYNRVNDISYEETENIRSLLTACADVMRFDRDNLDRDTLMKYILCTHENFAIITNLSPETSISDSGMDGISIVNGNYIDSILTSVFKLTPEHPPVNALVDRGYCYSNGLYYYKNIFNTSFYTDIRDLIAVHDLGGGIYHVVFSDVYYENGTATPEYSFAVIQKSDVLPYSLIRLGMGEPLLSDEEIIAYTPQRTYQNPRWYTPSPDYVPSSGLSLSALIAIIAVSAFIFIIGTAALIRELTKK